MTRFVPPSRAPRPSLRRPAGVGGEEEGFADVFRDVLPSRSFRCKWDTESGFPTWRKTDFSPTSARRVPVRRRPLWSPRPSRRFPPSRRCPQSSAAVSSCAACISFVSCSPVSLSERTDGGRLRRRRRPSCRRRTTTAVRRPRPVARRRHRTSASTCPGRVTLRRRRRQPRTPKTPYTHGTTRFCRLLKFYPRPKSSSSDANNKQALSELPRNIIRRIFHFGQRRITGYSETAGPFRRRRTMYGRDSLTTAPPVSVVGGALSKSSLPTIVTSNGA